MTEIDCGLAKLRPWRSSDVDALVEAADNPSVARYLRDIFPSPYTHADAVAWIKLNETADVQTNFAIDADGTLAGGIGLRLFDGERRLCAEIGYWLAEPFWGRGIITAACRVLTDYAFETYGLKRVEAAVFSPNVASRRVLEKCGYTCEGLMKNAAIKHGEVLDVYMYAATR